MPGGGQLTLPKSLAKHRNKSARQPNVERIVQLGLQHGVQGLSSDDTELEQEKRRW